MNRRISIVLVVAALLGVLTVPSGVSFAAPGPSSWTPWVLSSADQLRLPPPPGPDSVRTQRELRELRVLQSQRTRSVKRQIHKWNDGPATIPWTKVALDQIIFHRLRPSFAARALGILQTAMADAVIAAADSRATYPRIMPRELDDRINPFLHARGSTYPAVQAVVAGVAEEILEYVFPDEPVRTFTDLATEAVESRLYAGVNYRSDVVGGRALGHRIAELAIARAGTDGSTSSAPPYGPKPQGDAYWQPTPPGFEPSIGAGVGTWKPWLIESGANARTGSGIPGPPTYGSELFLSEVHEVMDVKDALTPEQTAIAHFWDDGTGTVSPPGHWHVIAMDLAKRHSFTTAQTARVLAYLAAAEMDATIAFYDAKYFWYSIRPITAIRRLCDGGAKLCSSAEIQSDPARATYPDWLSLIVNPPFPSYPSGHSTFSGAAARVLGYFFPDEAGSLDAQAGQAALSRLYGGIHFRSDNDDGLTLGRYVGDVAIIGAAFDEGGAR